MRVHIIKRLIFKLFFKFSFKQKTETIKLQTFKMNY